MAYRSSSFIAEANGTSAPIPVPAGAAVNDIAVCGIYIEDTDAITLPANFAVKADLATSPVAQGRLLVAWKRLIAADTGTYTFTWTNSPWRAGQCVLFTGRVSTGDPFDGTPGTAEAVATGTTLNVSTSPAGSGGDAVGLWTNFATTSNAFTVPTNYVERQDTGGLCIDTRDGVAAGSTGNVTATSGTTDFMKAFLGVLAAEPSVPSVSFAVQAAGPWPCF